MMPTQRRFLDWHRPVLDGTAEHFATLWAGGGLLDLGEVLAVVPTRQAGRRLRERLAGLAAAQGKGVLAPRVVMPEFFVGTPPVGRRIATGIETTVALARTLHDAGPLAFPALFPLAAGSPAASDFAWALGVAGPLCELRTLLGELGLSIADAGARLAAAPGDNPGWEPERWADLARIETLAVDWLHDQGLEDATVAKRLAAEAPRLPDGIRRVVIVAVPNPLPLAVTAWARLAETMPVEVLVHAPAALADAFDAWGRPLTEAWLDPARLIEVPVENMILVAKPADQAAAALGMLGHAATADIAIGVPDTDVLPHLEQALCEHRIAFRNSAGKPVASHAVAHMVEALGSLAVGAGYEAFATLLRNADMLGFLAARQDHERLEPSRLLTQLDRLQNEHLPATFADVRRHLDGKTAHEPDAWAELASACTAVGTLLETCARGDVGGAVLDMLHEVYEPRRLVEQRSEDRELVEVAAELARTCEEIASAAVRAAGLDVAAQFQVLADTLRRRRVYPEPEHVDLDLDGWLELHWNDAPHLVVTGFNDGRVPEAVVGHVFLPDSSRRQLGLLHNDQRLARDAYLLAAMQASRRAGGSLRLVLGKTTEAGDALKPSRLLFRCTDRELPARVTHLFREVGETGSAMPWQAAWKLRVPSRQLPTRLRVTAFRDYLACPCRFYLKHVLRMDSLDDRKTELDAADFGTVCHAALDDFGNNADLRDCDDAARIAAFLVARADERVRHQYGPNEPAAVLIQLDALRQRLRAAATCQAELRRQGWHIRCSEYRLGGTDGVPFHNLRVSGIVDRIDVHDDGRVRVLDYKTFEKPDTPEARHLKTVRRRGDDDSGGGDAAAGPHIGDCLIDGTTRRWLDLQLPLYCRLLESEFGPNLGCGYFILPKAVTETAVVGWDGLSTVHLDAAEACARRIVDAVRAGIFWPPAENVRHDDFAGLFFGGAQASLEPLAAPKDRADRSEPTARAERPEHRASHAAASRQSLGEGER